LAPRDLRSLPTRRSSDLVHLGAHVLLDVNRDVERRAVARRVDVLRPDAERNPAARGHALRHGQLVWAEARDERAVVLDEDVGLEIGRHTSELQSDQISYA